MGKGTLMPSEVKDFGSSAWELQLLEYRLFETPKKVLEKEYGQRVRAK